MIYLFATLLLILFLYGTFRLSLQLALLAARKWARLDIKLGRIGFLSVKDVSIRLSPALCLEIETIRLSSCYTNKKVRRPVVVCICGLSLKIDLVDLQEFIRSRPIKSSTDRAERPAFLKLLPFAKFIGLEVDNVNLMLNKTPVGDGNLNITIDRLTPDATTLSNNRVMGCLRLESLRIRLLSSSARSQQICLASIDISQTLQVDIDPKNFDGIEAIDVSLSHCSLICAEGFLRHLSAFHSLKAQPVLQVERIQQTSSKSQHLALMPKNIQFNLGDAELVLEKEPSQRDLVMTVTSVALTSRQSFIDQKLTNAHGNVTLKGTLLKSGAMTLLAVTQLRTTLKVEDCIADIEVQLSGGFLGYDQQILNHWITLFCQSQNVPVNDRLTNDHESHDHAVQYQTDDNRHDLEDRGILDRVTNCNVSPIPLTEDNGQVSSSAKGSHLFRIFSSRRVKLSVDVVETSVAITTDACGLEAGVSRWKTSVTLKPMTATAEAVEFDDFQYEFDVTSLYCRQAEKNVTSSELNAKQHLWNTLVYAGVAIAKGNRFSQQLNHDVLIDSLRLELSSALLDTIDKISEALLIQWRACRGHPGVSRGRSGVHTGGTEARSGRDAAHTRSSLKTTACHVQLTNANLFFCHDNKASAMVRCDAATLQRRPEKSSLTLSEVRVTYFLQTLKFHPILRSCDLQDFVAHVRLTEVMFGNDRRNVGISLPDGVYVAWSLAVHMCFHEIISRMLKTATKYNGEFGRLKTPGSSPRINGSGLRLSIETRVQLEMHLPNNHRVFFTAVEASLYNSDSETNFFCPRLQVIFDGHDIFDLEGMHVGLQNNNDRFRTERASAKTLELATNRAWLIAFDKFQIVFPYEYNFAECFDELKNLNKWRKIIYKKSPAATTGKLPPDLHITAKTVLVQLSDDPFEVKLRHIYETLCDVGVMAERRLLAMDQRIEALQRTQGIIPGSKIQELYSLLSQKTSEDYIRRIRQLYDSAPLRTTLFSWTMEGLEIFALADTSYDNKEKIIRHMKEIDPDSPLPNDGTLDFVSLFCRTVRVCTGSLVFQFRDFPHAVIDIRDFHVWGRLIGAEPLGTAKAKRSATIDMGAPWGRLMVERNMPQMKFFHDFSADIVSFNLAYGPCWEPTMAQVNLAMNKVSRPSIDPSPPLPFWDKFRLLLHGRLTISIQQTRWLYHASLDPYNVTEFMDWTWTEFLLDWTNAKWILHGNLDVFSKTASKYNDCRLVHLPKLRLSIRLEWLCSGNSNDHHSVMPSAPDKIPDYAIQDYDSYRVFRSKGMNVCLGFEIPPNVQLDDENPSGLFFASTLRWIDKIKMCMNRVSRPIRRGPLFRLISSRKKPITRHVQNVQVSVDFPRFQLCYWVSFSKQNGAMIESDRIMMNVSLRSDRRTIDDGLKHKPNVMWCIRHFSSHLSSGVVWLCSANSPLHEKRKERNQTTGLAHKSFLLKVDDVSYQREEEKSAIAEDVVSTEEAISSEEPVHKVKVYNLKSSWTTSNRNVVFSLYDGYSKAQVLKDNLLSEALKGFKVETNQTPKAEPMEHVTRFPQDSSKGVRMAQCLEGRVVFYQISEKNCKAPASDFNGDGRSSFSAFSPQFRVQSGPIYCLLQQLIKEAGSVAVHEELAGKVIDLDSLQGIGACQTTDDIICKNWDVELFNSQVMLKGCETSGYVIVSAAKTALLSSSHCPFWSDGQLKTKTTLVGSVECMQYYATVDSSPDGLSQSVRWLSREDVEDRPQWNDADDGVGLAGMAGSGQCVGGVVSDTASTTSEEQCIQLQRIISRSRCQFFCAWYGEVTDEPLQEIPIPPSDVDMMKRPEGVDAFTLLHNDLNICTNSLQYATILDIVNNLLLYVDPKKKELTEKLQDMRFKRHLSSAEDQRTPISQRQDTLRKLVSTVRSLEREHYMLQRKSEEDRSLNEDLCQEIQDLRRNLEETKEQANTLSEELAIMVSCYRESRLQVMSQRQSSKNQIEAITVRRIDLYFKHAEWRMTEADGQIGIADLVLSNFLYTNIRTTDVSREKTDSGSRHLTDSGSHHLELGWFKVTNLLPNSIYTDVLVPQEQADAGFADRQVAFRVYCEFTSPVGGISVKKHLEVNVVPLTIQLTTRFYTTVMAFFFPGKPVDSDDECDSDTASISSSGSSVHSRAEKKEKKRSLARAAKALPTSSNDIDKMKERAARNNLFVLIKIPEVPLRVSYKSENEKLIPNIHDFRFVLPRLEYHNQTWMWHDLAMAIKSDCKKVIVPQVLKHKLHIKSRSILPDVFLPEADEHGDSDSATSDARKAQVLFGATLMDGDEKPSKRKHLIGKHNK